MWPSQIGQAFDCLSLTFIHTLSHVHTVLPSQIGQAFDCLSLTLEMPFKDSADLPEPVQASRQTAVVCGCKVCVDLSEHMCWQVCCCSEGVHPRRRSQSVACIPPFLSAATHCQSILYASCRDGAPSGVPLSGRGCWERCSRCSPGSGSNQQSEVVVPAGYVWPMILRAN